MSEEEREPTPTLVIPTMDVISDEELEQQNEIDSEVYYIYPVKRTSILGIMMLLIGLVATVPFITFVLSGLPTDNAAQPLVTWSVCFILTFIPITLYLILQTSNKIGISTNRKLLRYQSAFGNSVLVDYSEANIEIVYFSNTSAQGRFTKKGWAGIYRGGKMLFRLNMERWDYEDLWWLSQNLPARIVVVHELKGYKYVERRFKGYFPMYASDPIASRALIILGIFGGVFIEFIMWSAAIHFLGF